MSSGHGEGGSALIHDDDHEEHEEHVNHEAWVIPYADLLTLLMALFIVLWATSQSNSEKFAAAAASLRQAFNSGSGEEQNVVTIGSPGVLDGKETGVQDGDYDESQKQETDTTLPIERNEITTPAAAFAREQERQAAKAKEISTFDRVQKQISGYAAQNGVQDKISFRREERGLIVSFVTDDVLFDPGSADLKPQGQNILSVVAEPLKNINHNVMIEGHTDNQPINTARFPSNWELSSGRGTSVLRFLTEQKGFPTGRIASAGYGDTKAADDNASSNGRAKNRRVEIVVLADPNL